MKEIFYDKYNNQIRNGDVLCFDSGNIYTVVDKDGILCLKCNSKKLPFFELDKIAIGRVLVSAYRKNT